MTIRPRLVRSVPFWALLVVSIASAAAGAVIVVDKIGTMTTTLTDGTATSVDVYVGQSLAVVGTVLVGAGIVGVLLALTVAAAATLRPRTEPATSELGEVDELDEPEEPETAQVEASVVADEDESELAATR